ncbi:tetratricopeptide repeat protein [Mucilaginibacter puniceus]
MIRKIAIIALGLACIGSSVFAQSLADAKKAIDVEQYQKAKAMLKNLTVTQAKDDETFFQLGWVYLLQDYIDSAKTVFNQGIAAHPKSALNYVGLGVAARLSKDNAGMLANFNKAIEFTGRKESAPWLYMGKGYLLLLPNTKAVTTDDADKAIAALLKGKEANAKDAEVALALGNAYRSKRETGPAYENYTAALALDPKMPAARVAQGVLFSNAHNFDGAIDEYKAALAIDPNYGPAYREWAETDLDWSFDNRAQASDKINEGVEKYEKYLSLTDHSDETLMRYADFLINAGRWKELQAVAGQLARSSGTNLRALRYSGYAGYETKDYEKGMKAMREWFAKAGQNRILPRDYFYKGRLEAAAAKDTVAAIQSLKKAADLDSTLVEPAYVDIIALRRKQNNYLETAKAYEEKINKMGEKAPIADYIYKGMFSYFAFNPKSPDSTLLIKGDSSLSFANRKLAKPSLDAVIFRARIAELKENREDLNKMVGYAKPFYEKFIELMLAGESTDPRMIKNWAEAYGYMGNYYLYHDKDEAKAEEMYTKALEKDPTNRQAKFFFEQKAAAATPKKPTK